MVKHEFLPGRFSQPETGNVLYLPHEASIAPERLVSLMRDSFLELAREVAEQRARSYRGFNVGAVVLSSFGGGSSFGFTFGANRKPTPDAGKVCAERLGYSLTIAPHPGQPRPDRILAFYVWGEPQPDPVSGKITPTLHPCGDCRVMFELQPEIDDGTVVCTGGPDGATEEFTVRELIDFHRGDVAS